MKLDRRKPMDVAKITEDFGLKATVPFPVTGKDMTLGLGPGLRKLLAEYL